MVERWAGVVQPSPLESLIPVWPCWAPAPNWPNSASSSEILFKVALGGIGGVLGRGSILVPVLRVLNL